MKVRVLYRPSYFGGSAPRVVTIEISDTCPKCGEKRGEPYNHNFHEDGDWLSVDRWDNSCGHLDKYADVLVESGYAAAPQ